jgi:hypothetical protein
MYNPNDLHSWSKQYREDALREAQARHLADSTPDNRGSGDGRLFGFVRRGALALLLRRGVPAEERSL